MTSPVAPHFLKRYYADKRKKRKKKQRDDINDSLDTLVMGELKQLLMV